MKAIDIINNEDLKIKDKLAILTSYKKKRTDLDTYINYYKGKQDILKRLHPTDVSKNSKINKLVINLYKKITNTATYFLFGKEPTLVLNNPNEKTIPLFEEFKASYKKSKTGNINSEIGIYTLGYSESAEILYAKENDVKYRALSPENEDLCPFYDEKGDLDAFTRVFKLDTLEGKKLKETTYYEVYTAKEKFTYMLKSGKYYPVGDSDEDGNIKNETYDKIPIVYYSMEEPIALIVKTLLDRLNLMQSTLGDVNDSFAFPIMMLLGLLVKNENGETSLSKNAVSILHMTNETENGEHIQGDAKYLTWDSKPESAIYELETLYKMSLYLTQTPDLSFDNLKGLSGVSGVALRLMFTDAIAQSDFLKYTFFELSRRINIHKSLLSKLRTKDFNSLDISVQFNNPIPEDVSELINNLANAKISGILSTETAVSNNPYVKNTETEIKKINNEEVSGESFNP